MKRPLTPYTAAERAGVSHDEALILQLADTKLLAAAARGEVDLNVLAKHELACRGLDHEGRWVGFPAAGALFEREFAQAS